MRPGKEGVEFVSMNIHDDSGMCQWGDREGIGTQCHNLIDPHIKGDISIRKSGPDLN